MLRIAFHQFRCWENLMIEAPIGSITLIKGNSGVGKTTILQGIAWCLYGNIRLVGPNYVEKAKTRVIIELPYNLNGVQGILSINRQKNPNRLMLSHGEKVYEDKVAQAIIDDIFGTHEIWLASCYTGQGCRNTFLTAPNTGKMEILNSIAFHEEDPTTYIERIDANITETDYNYKAKLATFTSNLNTFQSLISSVDINKALNPEQTNDINQRITNLIVERNKSQALKSQRDINIAVLNNLERQLDVVNNTKVVVTEPDDVLVATNNKYGGAPLDTTDNIYSNMERAMNIIPLLQRRDDLHSETIKLDRQLSFYNINNNVIYTQEDYQDALSQETAYRDNQRLAQNLGVVYDKQAISDSIQRYREILSSQDRLSLEKERDNLQNNITALEIKYAQQSTPLQFPDITPQEIIPPDYSKYNTELLSIQLNELSKKHGSIQAHIQHLQKGYDVIQCPHCKGPVRYQQGILTSAETGPSNRDDIISAQKELASINSDIDKINKTIQNLTTRETADRAAYERAVFLEQKRLDSLKEKVRQLELEKQRRDISNQTQFQHIQEQKGQLIQLNNKIDLLPECIGEKRLLTPKEIEQTHILIARLNSITVLPSPITSSEHIRSCLTYQNLLAQNTIAQSNYAAHVQTIPAPFKTESILSIQHYIDTLRSYWNQIREMTSERIRLDQLKISLETQISDTAAKIGVDPSPNIDSITTEIIKLQEFLSLSVKAHQAIKYHTQITSEREEVVNLITTLSDLQSLRQYAVETECRILQQVVDSINASIESVCSTLFDRDINITLSLFKTLKTTKNVKPMANFSISYQGGVFDNISQMSGGEGDRASLALTLALSRLSSCPILMLDESLASLDINMKEAAIRTIRENTNNTVLIIMHDGIEGIFDSVLNIDEIRDTQPLISTVNI